MHQKPSSLKILGIPLSQKAKISVTKSERLLEPLHTHRDGAPTLRVSSLAVKAVIAMVRKDQGFCLWERLLSARSLESLQLPKGSQVPQLPLKHPGSASAARNPQIQL